MTKNPSSKPHLRKHFLEIRRNLPEDIRNAQALAAAKIFLENIPILANDIVSAYHPVNNEISPLPILAKLKERGIATCLPKLGAKGQPLEFYLWQEGDDLIENKAFKIKEPTGLSNPVTPSVIIVPVLAFDIKRHRLGYGSGFYDITIARLYDAGHDFKTIGLAYDCQQTGLLPADSHDQVLDYIVTNQSVTR